MRTSRVLLGLALAFGSACAPAAGSAAGSAGAGGATSVRGDSKLVTEDELAVAIQLNLYDYVVAERPRWLRGGGPSSSRILPVTIFMDDTRMGDAQQLKTLSTSTVRMLRYFEASAAQQKFSGRDLGPVIQVIIK
jgi:hypothetical protein